MNPEPSETINGYWMPTIVIEEVVSFDREIILEAFKENNIDGRVFFWPLSMLPIMNHSLKIQSAIVYINAL